MTLNLIPLLLISRGKVFLFNRFIFDYSHFGIIGLDDSQVAAQFSVPADRDSTARLCFISTRKRKECVCLWCIWVCVFTLYLCCRCSTSILSRTTEICSIRTSFLPLSLRTPDTFWPFSTHTSRTSSHGRTHRLKRKHKKLQCTKML